MATVVVVPLKAKKLFEQTEQHKHFNPCLPARLPAWPHNDNDPVAQTQT